VLRVQGLASSRPLPDTDPLSPTNRRISIIVMNREAEDRFFSNLSEPEEPAASIVDPRVGIELPSISAPLVR
jgi:chemotaxis protein MotB